MLCSYLLTLIIHQGCLPATSAKTLTKAMKPSTFRGIEIKSDFCGICCELGSFASSSISFDHFSAFAFSRASRSSVCSGVSFIFLKTFVIGSLLLPMCNWLTSLVAGLIRACIGIEQRITTQGCNNLRHEQYAITNQSNANECCYDLFLTVGASARARMQQLKCGFPPEGCLAMLVVVQSPTHRCIAAARRPTRWAASLVFANAPSCK
jgi:hypothetical protein